ncbi:MAG TPA: tetratricopeptide repeat protein [Woeseiaceae bacterium]|nr:tetratricopeptide repeat protein [Woeseiaceae bacterium]
MNYRVLLLPALLWAAGCATTAPGRAPGDTSSPVPVERRGDLSPAGEALLIQGANERRAGDYGAASATLERALRIEPSAPALWLELARVRLLQGDVAQAGQLARKAGSLAPADSALASEAQRVIEAARRRDSL